MDWLDWARDRWAEVVYWAKGGGPQDLANTTLEALGTVSSSGATRSIITYTPAAGCCAHAALALSVMAPRAASRLFPKHDITNLLVMASFTGTSVWLWRRPHVSGTPPGRRFQWVFLGSSTYVLGSILMWAIIRSTVGHHPFVSISLGLISGSALAYTAVDYFNYIDRDFEPLMDVSEPSNHSDDENYDLDL